MEFMRQLAELTAEEVIRRKEYRLKVAEIGEEYDIISALNTRDECEIHMSEDGFQRFIEDSGLKPEAAERGGNYFPFELSVVCDGIRVFCLYEKLPEWADDKKVSEM